MKHLFVGLLVLSSFVGCGTSRVQLPPGDSTDGGSMDGGDADAGVVPDGGSLLTCGELNHPCCSGESCGTGLACDNGLCLRGRTGPTGTSCNSNVDCPSGSTCLTSAHVCTTSCTGNQDCLDGWTCGTESGHSGNVCTCTPSSETCNGKDDDCDGIVDNSAPTNQQCVSAIGVGEACLDGRCTCANLCGSACVDVLTDVHNCGACGHSCDSNQTCTRGTCTARETCAPGTPAEIQANCVCQTRFDCAAGNSAKWACAPGNKCVQICAASSDCETPMVCEDLVCRPPACGEDVECTSGQQCIGGACALTTQAAQVAGCAVLPKNAVINAGGTRSFEVATFDGQGHPVPYKGAVTWSSTVTGIATSDTGIRALFASSAVATSTGFVRATIGATPCTGAALTSYEPPNDFRVVVVDRDTSQPLSGVRVVVNAVSGTTDALGVFTTAVVSGPTTVSAYADGRPYVTIVGTTSRDILLPLPAPTARALFTGQLTTADFIGLPDQLGTQHRFCAGASLRGNLPDNDLQKTTGYRTMPVTVSLGTGTPYGPFDVPEGTANGLGMQMFGDNGGGHFFIEPTLGARALWSLGGNAIIGEVLRALGPVLNGGGGSTVQELLPMMLSILAPMVMHQGAGAATGLSIAHGDAVTISTAPNATSQSLRPSGLPRIHLKVNVPLLPSFVDSTGQTQALNTVLVQAGAADPITGFVPQGQMLETDQLGPSSGMVPDGLVDPLLMGDAAGTVSLRVVPRQNGLETAPWGVLATAAYPLGAGWSDFCAPTLFAPLNDQFDLGGVDRVISGRFVRLETLSWNRGESHTVDVGPLLTVPNVPTIAGRTFTLVQDVAGASMYRLELGDEATGWIVYYPVGTTTLQLPAVPVGVTDFWSAQTPVRLTTFGFSNGASYNGVVEFNGTDLDDFSPVTTAFSRRTVPRLQ